MEEWKEYKLREVGKITTGKTPQTAIKEFYDGDIMFVTPADINTPYKYISRTNRYLSKEGLNSISSNSIDKGSICVSCIGNIGYVGIVNMECASNQQINSITVNQEYDRDFVYYAIKNLWSYFKNYEGQSTTLSILNKGQFSKITIKAPGIDTQHKIASILSSLDDKIENNRRINENLEQQAQALFKSWFVDFEPFKNEVFVESELGMIPKGWRVEKIGNLPINVTDYVANGSFASLKENVKLYQTSEYAYFIRNTDLKSGKYEVYVDKHSYEFLSKSTLYGGEIIISNVGDVGSVHLCPFLDKPMTLGNNIIMLKSGKQYYSYFLYILFKWAYGNDLIMSIKGGSAQPKFNKTDFKSLKIIAPNDIVLEKYHLIISALFNKITEIEQENRRLAELRDTLLPKLMSGELKVDAINL